MTMTTTIYRCHWCSSPMQHKTYGGPRLVECTNTRCKWSVRLSDARQLGLATVAPQQCRCNPGSHRVVIATRDGRICAVCGLPIGGQAAA
jgi:hypothetical protein